LEDAIASPTQIAGWIREYFSMNQARTAQVLAGPKRETWFSAETFVALCRAAKPLGDNEWVPDFSCWGEQQFSTIFKLIQATRGEGDHDRKPDIVCYRPIDGPDAVGTVIEIKLVRNHEDSQSCLGELKSQLLNARRLFPNADVLGVIFVAAAPLNTPGSFEKIIARLANTVSVLLPEDQGFTWVPDHRFTPIFKQISTQLYYPAMSVSLTLAVLKYAPTIV
jgi:hypothetical protein